MYSVGSNIQPMTLRTRQRMEAVRTEVLRAEYESANQMYRRAQRLSSGNYSKAQQARMAAARPGKLKGVGLYSMRAPAPPQDVAILNWQTTRLKRSWRYTVVWKAGGDGTSITVWNTAPYAKYLNSGTRKMIARPLIARLQQLEGPARFARLARAKSLGLKGR